MIELFDGYAIDADEFQYILRKKLKKPTKTTDYTTLSYHTTLANALSALGRLLTREQVHLRTMTIQEACRFFESVEIRLQNIVKGDM